MEDFKGALSPESEQMLDDKLKFNNKWAELGDGYLIKIIDNKILSKVVEKLESKDVEMAKTFKSVLAAVIEEMPVIEI